MGREKKAVRRRRRSVDERSPLPQMLREQSLSHREIVLPYQEAKEALDLLRRAQWAVWGWEGWVKDLDGSHGFASGGVMGADMQRKEEKPGLTLFTDRFCFVRKPPKQRRTEKETHSIVEVGLPRSTFIG
jgi:hypothetical protein